MRSVLRWLFIVVVASHGLIHLMGVAEGFELAGIDRMTEPVGVVAGLLWLVAAVAVLATAVLVMLRSRWWWPASAVAAVVSQAMILTSWDDAKIGSIVNVVMLLAAGYGYAAEGPRSLRAEYRRRVDTVLGQPPAEATLTDADLETLPPPVAAYVRRSGAIGGPRLASSRARIRGRIRSGVDKPWMKFTGEQVNYYGPNPARLFFMDATMLGLPVDILHHFADHAATMRGRLGSVLPIVTAAGPDMTRAETVTLFNDMCFLAPAALVDAAVSWESVDDHRVRGSYTVGGNTISAELLFDDDGDLVDFVSRDRLRASADGKVFRRMPWSTSHRDYRLRHGYRVATRGEALWHPPAERRFCYAQMHVDDIVYNPSHDEGHPGSGSVGQATSTEATVPRRLRERSGSQPGRRPRQHPG